MKGAIIVLALTLTAFSCRQDEHMTARQKSVVINDAEQMLKNYYRDIAETGLTAEFKYLDHSPDFFWVPPGYTVALSYDSVAAIINEHAPLFKSVKNTFDTLKIVPISSDLA